jgi:hypothetical protein
MKSLDITLYEMKNDKAFPKKYTTPFVSSLASKTFTEMRADGVDFDLPSVEEVERMVDLVCLVFKNQFTSEQFFEGMPVDEMGSEIGRIFRFLQYGKTDEELQKAAEEAQKAAEEENDAEDPEEDKKK